MTKDDILTMASESYCWRINLSNDRTASLARLQRFAELVAAAEREACAKLAYEITSYEGIAAAIRARGQE
jgi:hypothetical protein